MGRAISLHFILMPFLIGIAPPMTAAAFGSFWLGFGAIAAVYFIGPVARGRRKFMVNPKLDWADHLRLLGLAIASVIAGTALGGFLFHQVTEVI